MSAYLTTGQSALHAPYSITLPLDDERATLELATMLASMVKGGDLVTLEGDLGAGKSTLARGVIRHLARDPRLEIPSPTFTLLQIYETPRATVAHVDLYRLTSPQEVAEIGWEEADNNAIILMEWPERAGDTLPHTRLNVRLVLDSANPHSARTATLTGHGAWATRLERAIHVFTFLGENGWVDAERTVIQGDASTRLYERLTRPDGKTAILMDAPRRPDGPAIRSGKSYSVWAKLAEDVTPFVAMTQGLRERGFSAPHIYAADLEQGLLLLEDFGNEPLLVNDEAVAERHSLAVDTLVKLHSTDTPPALAVSGLHSYTLRNYDLDTLLVEAELFLEWYLPHRAKPATAEQKAHFFVLWRDAFAPVLAEKPTWVLRDYHSPNIMWLQGRESTQAIGLLDFQDALMGSAAYDVVSLLQDARVDIPEAMELHLLSRYVGGRRMADLEFDAKDFARSYAVLGAQRATKILGIFIRLHVRDGKPAYLKHIPRLLRYLERDLAHPHLAELQAWFKHALEPDTTPSTLKDPSGYGR